MNTQIKKGVLELCVLHLIGKKEYYGYELITQIEKHINISEGTVYPILKKLNQEKRLSCELRESAEGPARKYYKITAEGQKYLAELKTEWDEFYVNINNLLNNREDNNG